MRVFLFSAVCAAILSLRSLVDAQTTDQPVDAKVNYVYASQFGFGTYSIGGLTVGIYSLPFQWTFERVLGDANLRLRVPLTYGRYDFDGTATQNGMVVGVHAVTNSLAVQPGAYLDIPLFERFTLTPLAAWGPGFTFGSSGHIDVGAELGQQPIDLNDVALYTYQVGLSSLYEVPWRGFELLFGMAFIWAGDATFDGGDGGTAEDYGTFFTGVEGRHDLGFQIGHVTPQPGLFFVYHYFAPELQFSRGTRTALEVQQIFELGIDIGSSTPMQLPYFDDLLDRFRFGLSYQTAPGFNGFRLNLGFPF